MHYLPITPYPYIANTEINYSYVIFMCMYYVGCTGCHCCGNFEGTLPANEGHQTIMGNLEI